MSNSGTYKRKYQDPSVGDTFADRSVDKIMAYLNCAFCPAQAFPVPTDPFIEFGQGITKLKCISKHTTYVNTEDINGNTRADSDEIGFE